MIRGGHPHAGEGCGSARPATKAPVRSEARKPGMRSDNALTEQPGRTQPAGSTVEPARSQRSERSDGTGDDERQRLNRTTRTNATSWINLATSDEVPGRSEATKPGTRSELRANRKGPEGAALEDEARWPRPWAAPQGKIYTR